MALDFGRKYKEYYGSVNGQMPLLRSAGRMPVSVAETWDERINSSKKKVWKDNYVFTIDAFACHPDKKIKIVLNAKPLLEITQESQLQSRALVLPEWVYESLDGEEFTQKDLQKMILGIGMKKGEAQAHPILRAFARTKKRLNAYTNRMFPEMKKRFDYDTAMGTYLDSFREVPTIRAAVVYRLENWSRLYGGNNLNSDVGRLVGYLAPEAQGAPDAAGIAPVKPSLETALSVVNKHLGKALVIKER